MSLFVQGSNCAQIVHVIPIETTGQICRLVSRFYCRKTLATIRVYSPQINHDYFYSTEKVSLVCLYKQL